MPEGGAPKKTGRNHAENQSRTRGSPSIDRAPILISSDVKKTGYTIFGIHPVYLPERLEPGRTSKYRVFLRGYHT